VAVRKAKTRTLAACGLIALLAGCGSQASSKAAGGAKNYSATSAYLRAREAFLQSARAGISTGQAPMAAIVAHVRESCPGSLRGTPADKTVAGKSGSAAQVRTELAAATFLLGLEQSLEAAQRQPQAAAGQQFEATVAALHWSDPRINKLMQTFAQIASQERHQAAPDVCREISEWSSSGYKTLPAVTHPELGGIIGRQWMRDMAALGCGRFSAANPASVLSALSLYDPPGVRPTVREVASSEQRLEVEEHHARADATRSLGKVLGIDFTLPPKRPRTSDALNASRRLSRCTGKPERVSETVKEPADAQTEPLRQ
jgi:hypothetical protein